jgi:hypothetical protein
MFDEPPISPAALQLLFEYLDCAFMAGHDCDSTLAITEVFLRKHRLPVEPMIEWLEQNGGYCDCEVMLNVALKWDDAVGYFGPEEEADGD